MLKKIKPITIFLVVADAKYRIVRTNRKLK